jgi:lipid-A-disaccharide synthase
MFVAGETSGDHHAAAAIAALRNKHPSLQCFGLGGPAMQAAGLRLDLDLASRSVIGFIEVLKHFGYFRRAFALAERLLRDEKPDLLVLVDYPGFNLRLAKTAKALGIPIAYYISPQVWAWKRGRVKTMAQLLRKMLVTFPFEEALYKEAGLDCRLVGNPLLDAIPSELLWQDTEDPPAERQRALRARCGVALEGPLVGLLPGSREQEIKWLLPVMLQAADLAATLRPDLRFVVVKLPAAPMDWYQPVLAARAQGLAVTIFESDDAASAYALRASCDAALVASGTATLETALLGVPFAILYRVHPLTYFIGKRLVKIHSIGLANVVAGRRVVPEFLQEGLDPVAINLELMALVDQAPRRAAQRAGLAQGLRSLGGPGVASRVAEELITLAQESRRAAAAS